MCTSNLGEDEDFEKEIFDIIYESRTSSGEKTDVAREFAEKASKRFVTNLHVLEAGRTEAMSKE